MTVGAPGRGSAGTAGRDRRPRTQIIVTIGSQALSSMSNAGLALYGSFVLSAEQFSAVVIAFIAYRLMLAIQDAAVSTPTTIEMQAVTADDRHGLVDQSWGATGLLSGSGAILIAAIGVASLPIATDIGACVVAAAAGIVFLIAHEALRGLAFAVHRPEIAALGDAAWVVPLGVTIGIVELLGADWRPALLIAAWAASSAVGVVVMSASHRRHGVRPGRPQLTLGRTFLRTRLRESGSFVTESLVRAAGYDVAALAGTLGYGRPGLATLRTGMTAFSPLEPLRVGVARWFLPAIAPGPYEEGTSTRRVAIVGASLAAVMAVGCVVLAQIALVVADRAPADSAWADVAPLLLPLSCLAVLRAANTPALVSMRAARKLSVLVRFSLAEAVTIVALTATVSPFGVAAVAWAFAAHRAVLSIVIVLLMYDGRPGGAEG